MDKNILNRLMKLDSKEADKKLILFAEQIVKKAETSKNNEEIFEQLELIEEFVYKVPIQAVKIVKNILKSKPIKPKIYRNNFLTTKGKGHEELLLKCIELMKELRYISPDEVFSLLLRLSSYSDKNVRAKANEALGKQVEYNYQVLLKIGYQVQRRILNTLLSWDDKRRLKNVETITILIEKMLEASFDGATMKDENTFVFHRGSLKPTEDLKKIRTEVIDLGFRIIKNSRDLKIKLKLLNAIKAAAYSSDYGGGEEYEKFKVVIKSDIKQLVSEYKQLVFKGEEGIIADAPIVYEIEGQLSWFNVNHKKNIPEIGYLLERIRKDDGLYSVYKILAGDAMDFRFDVSYEESIKEQGEKIQKALDSITGDTEDYWLGILNQVASYKDVAERWKLNHFLDFLARISRDKPEIADRFLEKIYREKMLLKSFTGSFLAGFRLKGNVLLWDKYVEKIILEKDPQLIVGLIDSFEFISREDLKNICSEDITLFEKIIKKVGHFDFLKKEKSNFSLHRSIFGQLLYIYKSNEAKVRPLIISEIKINPRFASVYIDRLSYAIHSKWLDLKEWTHEERQSITNLLVEVKDLDYQALQILNYLAESNLRDSLQVFIHRIYKSEKIKEGNKLVGRNYDPVPYHFEQGFQTRVSTHPEYPTIVSSWIKNMTKESSVYNWEIKQLLHGIGGNAFHKAQIDLIDTGEKNNINKVLDLLDSMESPDLDLVMRIVEKTRDEKIWNELMGKMSATGIVSGEYGIANAHKELLEQVKKEGAKTTSQNVRDFISQVMTHFEEQIKREIKSTDEEKAIRKSEFTD